LIAECVVVRRQLQQKKLSFLQSLLFESRV
jgi:hypothetical protein